KNATVISLRTRKRVARAAHRLGYVPNQAARSLVTRASRTLGLMIPDVTDPIHGQVVTGFEQEAAASGYTVIMANGFADPARERRAVQFFLAHRTDGIALMGSVMRPQRIRTLVRPTHIAFINGEYADRDGRPSDLPAGCIRSDDPSGIDAVVRHLMDTGYRRIVYLSGPRGASNTIRRNAALRALRTAGVTGDVVEGPGRGDHDASPGVLAAQLARDRPDAVICYDDKLALRTIDALRALEIAIPDDIGVVGFDDIPFAGISNPRLTTVAQRSEEMGRLVVTMLRRAIETGEMPPSVRLPVRLIVRESTLRHGAQAVGPTAADAS
ncbi:MAG: LacI family DNA-binding transcriptional regulator, partial [Armatimonadota bacterium]